MNNTTNTLPENFQFTVHSIACIYTATFSDEYGQYRVTWPDCGGSGGWFRHDEVSNNIDNGYWKIDCDCTQGETANIPPHSVASIYDPISFLQGAMNEGCCEDNVECHENISLLDYLKGFTETIDAAVTIADGEYIVYYNDIDYKASCECDLVEICEALMTVERFTGHAPNGW